MVKDIEPPYPLIREELERGTIVPFLGAGASRLHGGGEKALILPSGGELSRLLAEATSFPSKNPRERADLAAVASYFAEINGRKMLRRQLRSHLAKEVHPRPVHEFLASLGGHRLIVTTNYDTLLEQAFRAAGRLYHLVVHPVERDDWRGCVLWWPPGAERPETPTPSELLIDLDTESVIYKMHGTVAESDEWDNFVITEDDYTDFLSRMTSPASAIPAIFPEHFRERNFLFIGYSLSDWNLRVILKNLSRHLQAEGRGSDFAAWAIQLGPSLLERKLWEKRRVNIFDMDIDRFVSRLREPKSPVLRAPRSAKRTRV